MSEHDIGRRGIDAGTWVKIFLKSEAGTRVRGRIIIVPADNVSYVEVQQMQEDDASV